jgi:hypothetical protein
MDKYYKYTDARGLAATLLSNSLRLSRPKDFNDPFDVRIGQIIPTNLEEYLACMARATHEIMLSDFDHSKLPNSPIRNTLIKINTVLRALPPSDREEVLKEFNAELPNYNRANILSILKEQQDQLAKTVESLGVFSCCMRNDDPLMWAHYADKHQGAVIELQPSLEKKYDSALKLLRPVQYTDDFAVYVKPEKMAQMQMFLTPRQVAREVHDILFYSKSKEWEYEQEHRLTIIDFIKTDKEFALLRLNPNEVSAIYFGIRFKKEQIKDISNLAKLKFPSVRLYQMVEEDGAAKLVAKPLTAHPAL